jgi:hypothetical protein
VKFIFTACAREDATSVLKFSQPKKVHLRRKLGFSAADTMCETGWGKIGFSAAPKIEVGTQCSSESKKLMASERKVSN